MKIKILMLSNQSFDSPLKTNKWHVANVLSQKGYNVVFVDPPLRFKALKKFIYNIKSRAFKNPFYSIKTYKNVVVYSPINIFNFKPFSLFNTYLHTKSLNEVLKKHKSIDEKLVLWVYHFDYPDLEDFIKNIKYDMLIYDVVDEYAQFPEYKYRKKVSPKLVGVLQYIDEELKIRFNQKGLWGQSWVNYRENWLIEKSNVVFASAPGLFDRFKKSKGEVYYLPNAASISHFDKPQKSFIEPSDIKNIKHPRIGFTGAIDSYKYNFDLVYKCAVKYPEYQFIMIGPEKVSDPTLNIKDLKDLKNVHFLGLKKWEETPSYFAYFDAYFIPSALNDYTIKGCFPVKYFESLSSGLPTVVIELPAYKGFDVDGYVSKTEDEFIVNLKKAVTENNKEKVKKRKVLASKNSWEGKVDKQLKIIMNYLKK